MRLLRPGDRVDVLATTDPGTHGDAGADARIVARHARVSAVPEPGGGAGREADSGSGSGPGIGDGPEMGDGPGDGFGGTAEAGNGGGALVVLSVTRPTAARLAGAAVSSRLAVTLC